MILKCIIFFSGFILFNSAFGQSITFNYTGSAQTWVVPPCVNSINVIVAGAEGGPSLNGFGGNGVLITATIPVVSGQVLQINVGGIGGIGNASGGWNGGGNGKNANSPANRSGGGGGASDIRFTPYALANRFIVAGGGGGFGGGTLDVSGGSANCNNGGAGTTIYGGGGGGGTQIGGGGGGAWGSGTPGGGGILGFGGQGAQDNCNNNSPGGGGGGGYYGGGGGGSDCWSMAPFGGGGGGGGSSLLPAGGVCTPNTNTGNGYVTISWSLVGGVATASNTGPYCPGQTIQLNATGGGTYSWTGPNGFTSTLQNPTIANASPLNSGVYTVVTNNGGCIATGSATVIINAGAIIGLTQIPTSCFLATNGSIAVSATGSSPGYNVSWNGVSSGDPTGIEIATSGASYSIPSLGVGLYTVTVISANGCVSTASTTVAANVGVTGSATFVSPLCAGLSNGNATVSVSNGVAPYQISWTGTSTGNPAGDEISSATGTYLISNLLAGNYAITITDAVGCFNTFPIEIMEPLTLVASALNTSTLCNGSSDGTVTGTATGGTAPYDMSWVGPNTGNPAGTEINTDGGSYTVNGAPSGAYTLTMTDANGCLATALTNLTQPLGIVLSATLTPPLCNGATNGIISINATGGTAGYDLSWSGPTSDNPIGLEISIDAGSYLISNLSAGTYTVTAIDQNGCSDSIISTLIPPPSLTFLATPTAILCNGGNGSVLVTASNGTPGYDVSWTGTMSGNPNGTEINASGGTYTIPALIAGSYQLTVTDQNGCIDTSSVVIIEPTLIQASSIETTTLCQNSSDGTTQITVSGGIAPYNIILTGNAIFNPLGDEITGIGGNYTFNNLATGNYTANITDANNCNSTLSIVIIAGNILPVITLVGDTICSGQSSTLSASATPVGGTFLWGNGTSNSSITISPIVTTPYAVLYNYSGCLAQLTVSVVVNPIPTVSVTNAIICEGQSATLTAASLQPAGGSLLWSTGETTQSISVSPSSNTTYTVVYTLNGCSSPQASATVTVNPVPQITINNVTICNGDATTLTATPDLPGGTFQWSPNGETTNSITTNPLVTSTYSAVYTLNGCPSSSFSTNVTVNPIPVVSFDADFLQGCAPLTSNFWNSSANANQSTNTQWFIEGNPVAVGDSTTLLFSNAGCYDITLEMTLNGCTGSQTYSDFVCVEGLPIANFTTDINSFSQSSQNVTFSNNSIGATQYIWNTGDGNTYTSEDLTHLFSNTGNGYTVWLTAISDLGCIDSTSVNLPFMEEIIYYIPNSFTPDGDGFNNVFTPIFTSGIDIHTFEMSIFNRWGEMVFETQDPLVGWDGSYGNKGLDVQSGVYTYKISFKSPQLDDRRRIVGHVSVIK